MNKKHFFLISIITFILTVKGFSQGKEVWKDIPYPKEANGNIKCIETDPQGNVWIGTEYGSLLKFDGKNWISIDLKSCMNLKFKDRTFDISSIAFNEYGEIWVATGLSIFYFDGNKWDFMWNNRLTTFINGINKVILHNDEVWLSGIKDIYRRKNGKWTMYSIVPWQHHANRLNIIHYNMEDPELPPNDTIMYDIDTNLTLPGRFITDMEFDNDGNLWYTTDVSGVVKFDGVTWTNYTKNNSSLPFDRIGKIKKDKQGKLWCGGARSGICVLENGVWKTYSDTINYDASDQGENVKSICPDETGNVWIGLDGGLKHRVIKFTGKSYKVYNETNPRTFGEGILITIDKNGSKWIVARIDPIIRTLSDGEGAFYTYKPKLTGKIYFDKNKNNQKDPDENYVANHKVKVQSTDQIAFTDSQGEYVLPLDYGTYQIRYLAEGYWSAVKDSTYIITLNDSITALPEIGVYAPDTIDLKRNISLGQNRCGFDVPMYYTYRNAGTVEIQGSIALKLDNEIKIQSSFPKYDSIQNNIAFYSINSLPAGVEKQITLNLKMPDFNRMGDKLSYTTQFYTKVKTFNDTLIRELRCAYDPNEKEVFTKSFTEKKYTNKKEVFSYTIRFQNVGNDTAINILIQDTLNNQFDLTTFNVVASSHKVNTTIDTNRVANFLFKNIQLPDSTTNETQSHGFVTFTIKRDNKIKEIQSITNTANIYFDYNPAVITNTTHTNLVDTVIYQKIQVCKGASYVFADNQRLDSIVKSENHVIVDTVNNQIRLKNILVSPFPEINIQKEVHICQGDSLQFGKQLLKTEGEYTEVFQSLKGCDSTVILKLKIDSLITTLSMIDDSQANKGFESNEKNATSYQWINCYENKNIEGENKKVFYPKQQGEFAVILKRNECVDTSDCVDFKLSGLTLSNVQSNIEYYPNPTNGNLFIQAETGTLKIEIKDLQGRIVYHQELSNYQGEKIHLDLNEMATTMVFVHVWNNKNETMKKIEIVK